MSSSSATSLSAAQSATSGGMIDVASIVSQLMTVEQQPLNLLNATEASYQSKLSAWGQIKSALSTFQIAVSGLSSPSDFQSLSTNSSSTSVATASAAASATPGSYSLNVTSLAQAQQLVAAGQTSQTTAIGSGTSTTLTFNFGTVSGGTLSNGTYTGASFSPNGNGTKTVTIDSSNNTLQGIASAINSANIGVTATIVNDGSSTPYRLVLSSSSTGAANSMQISVSGDSAISSLLSYDPSNNSGQNLNQTTAAQNANFTLNGIAISKAGNTVTDAIQGVTLNLAGQGATTVSVSQNQSAATTAVNNFVSAYNTLTQTLYSASAYNASTGTGAILQGDPTIMMLQNQLRSALNVSIGTTGNYTTLPDIGVTFQKDGTLAVDSTKLSAAMSSDFNSIASIFANVGSTTDPLVTYSYTTANTQPGSYGVYVTKLASQGTEAGSINLNTAGSTTIAAGTSINATLNGTTASVGLAAGTYTASELASMIQSSINGAATFSQSNESVVASIDSNGFLNITSNLYGSSSNVSLSDLAGTSISTFLGTPTTTAGTDVAGSIDGQAATGSGQLLSATAGNANGLTIQITGGTTGDRGTVNYSQGYAYTLNNLVNNSILSSGGMLDSVTNGLNQNIASIENQKTALNARLATLQQSYTKEFTNLDSMLSSMNSTQNFLTQQLASLPKA